MPQVHFESLQESLRRLPGVLQQIPDTLRDPSANPLQSAVLLGIGLAILLIILLSVLLLVVRPPEEDELFWEGEEGEEDSQEEDWQEARSRKRISRATVASVVVLVAAAMWVVTSVTTSNSQVCMSCHSDNVHNAAHSSDPHANVPCVSCHESGGQFTRLTVNLGARVEHIIAGRTGTAPGYGTPVESGGCGDCHERQIASSYLDRKQGVRVSHKEPLAAGAHCVDCHALKSGVVSAATVGMAPCLRCHDGTKAKAECSVCHVSDPGRMATVAAPAADTASQLVPAPQCGGCHKDMSKCTACHGISMPHTRDFMQYGHARVAALDIWDNGGKVCVKCHYPGHRSCQQEGCHIAPFPQHGSPTWKSNHQFASWGTSAITCGSCHRWNPNDRNGLNYCQICHDTKPANAKP